jgi:uncharacterized protein (TIGR03086 family)
MRPPAPVDHALVMTDMHPRRSESEELLELGRDREALDAATRDRGGVDQLDVILPALLDLVDTIADDDLDRPTPCAAFTVAGVLEHMIGGATAFAPAFRGADAAGPAPSGEIHARFRAAMHELGGAVHADGAPERTIHAPFGAVPGSTFARYVALDGLVHGWDLATAIDRPYAPADDLVAEVDAFARQLLGAELRDGDTFAAETEPPSDASPIERLVSFTGRSVPR